MKNLKLFTITLLLSVVFYSQAQTSIAPSKGDRLSFYLNGDVWETTISNQSHFALKVFSNKEMKHHVYLINFDMPEKDFILLMNFVGSLPNICITGEERYYETCSGNWILSSFDINLCDYSLGSNVDIFYLQSEIRKHCLNNR